MEPIRANETNFVYRGPTPEIADLPCRKEGADTFSIWELTDQERIDIALGANIRLGIYGMQPIPPVSLQAVAAVGPYAREGTDPIEIHINTRDEIRNTLARMIGSKPQIPPGPPSPPWPSGPRPVG